MPIDQFHLGSLGAGAMRLLTAILSLLMACSLHGQERRRRMLIAPTKAGSSCNNSCSASVFCEKFEGAFDDGGWTTPPTGFSFVAEARGSCSAQFARVDTGAASLGDEVGNNKSDTAKGYVTVRFRIHTSSITSGSSLTIFRAHQSTGSGGSAIWNITVTNASGTLKVSVIDAQGLIANSWQTITLDGWYLLGEFWNNTDDVSEWYLSTTDSLTLVDATTPSGTSRSVGQVFYGYLARIGTVAGTVFDIDSFAWDGSGFKLIEYQ